MSAKSCRDYLSLASTMIENDRPYSEVKKVLEKVRDMLMLGTVRFSNYEYFWFCKQYGIVCYSLNRNKEAEYFLKRAVSISMSLGEIDEVSIVVSLFLDLLIYEHRYREGINVGEKYISLCTKSEYAIEIEEGLCMLYFCYGWRRKAQNLANKVIRYRRKSGDRYYSESTCSLFKISYNFRMCQNKEYLLSDWYEVVCRVKGVRSSAAMEVLAEKARVIAHEDENRVTEAVNLLDNAIPVLEKNGCEYSIIDVPRLIAYQALLKDRIGESTVALKLFEKARPLFSNSNSDKEYLKFMDEEILRIKSTLSKKNTGMAGRK